jgi:hypothetical protein
MRKGAEHSYVSNPIYADHFHHNAAALPIHAICSNLVANMLITRQMIDTGKRNSYSDCKILTAVILEKTGLSTGHLGGGRFGSLAVHPQVYCVATNGASVVFSIPMQRRPLGSRRPGSYRGSVRVRPRKKSGNLLSF